MPTVKEVIQSAKWNLIIVSFICFIATIHLYKADYGKFHIIKNETLWIPFILTIFTFSIYGLSRLIGKKYNWIISLLGILTILYISIPIFFGVFEH